MRRLWTTSDGPGSQRTCRMKPLGACSRSVSSWNNSSAISGTFSVEREKPKVRRRHRNDGTYDDNALLHLAWFMRDVGDQDRAVWMEPRLFDLLAGVQSAMSMIHGSALPIVITSGYRTPAHNARTEGAARNSMHLYGYAADLLVPGYGPRATAIAAQLVGGGGIGLYADFIHLDVWRPRIWLGKSARRPGTAAPKPTPAAPASTPAATAVAPKPS